MRLRLLEARNFRRHRLLRLEFPDGLFALLGPNGAGKSTILEAIGFALFGTHALRTGKDLVRSDQAPPADAVSVCLELELGGQALRIVRELRGRSLQPTASLEADGVLLVRTGAGSSEAVTSEVERRLGMDRDAFHTTVVARQKELGRLAQATPAERKRLLLRMLGIERLDAAIAKARQERASCLVRLETLRSQLAPPGALEAELQAQQSRLAQARAARDAAQAAWQAAKARLETTLEAARAAESAAAAHEAARQAARDAAARLQLARETEGHRAAAEARAAESSAGHEALPEARAQADAAAAALAAARALQDEHVRWSAQRQQAARLAQELAQAQARLAALPEADATAAEADAHALAAAESALQEASERAALQAALARRAEAALPAARQRLQRAQQLGAAADCPTCERPLAEHAPRLLDRHAQELARLEAECAQARRAAEDAAAARAAASSDVDALRRRVAAAGEAARRRADAGRAVAELQARHAQLEAQAGPEPPRADLAAAGHALQEAQRRLARLEAAARAAADLPRLREQLSAARAALAQAAAEHAQAEAAAAADADAPQRLAAARKEAAAAAEAERAAERGLHAASAVVDADAARLEAVQERLARERERREAVEAAAAEAAEWTALAGAAGGGLLEAFRDHLVARVGPAVGAEASRLLALFSGGRYQEMLLDAEYEVYVTDNGVRYTLERFSGGEADLAYLALRLAVSRLLAERSGTELRFLALDEVFGSLDRERREHVAVALRGLGALYSQVLVISHLEGLEDALEHAFRMEDVGGEAAVRVAGGPASARLVDPAAAVLVQNG